MNSCLSDITLEGLAKYLDIGPTMVQMERLSLAFLPMERLKIFETAEQLIATLDKQDVQHSNTLMLTLDWKLQYSDRLIALHVNHKPLTTQLNQVLKDRWEFIKSVLTCQSQLPNLIAKPTPVSCTILILVDGLSWADFSAYWPYPEQAQPILVDGASTTKQGMKRVVGKPPIVERLSRQGCDRAYGFSYWTREDNTLTNDLFALFSNNLEKVRSFRDVLARLADINLEDTYIQVIRQGLDKLCHQHRDRPNAEQYVKDLARDWYSLLELLQNKGTSVQVFLTSDHGILWKEGHDLQVWESVKLSGSPRYLEYSYPSSQTLEVEFEGNTHSILNYPYIGRNFKSNEWGMHGGLSFEESVVPLLTATINEQV